MDICTFSDHYLNPLLDKLSKEANTTIVLLGDFNPIQDGEQKEPSTSFPL